MDNRPIGVFDSGLGGLTGVRELRRRLPHENIVYFGDTGRVPYGSRSPETILQYARQDIAFLLLQGCQVHHGGLKWHGKTSTYPAAECRKLLLPYLGVDAAAREAAFSTRNRRIGVIGTAATIRSRSYEVTPAQGPKAPGVEITARPCPLFLCRWWKRAMWITAPRTSRRSPSGHCPVPDGDPGCRGITLILGCTHYP